MSNILVKHMDTHTADRLLYMATKVAGNHEIHASATKDRPLQTVNIHRQTNTPF